MPQIKCLLSFNNQNYKLPLYLNGHLYSNNLEPIINSVKLNLPLNFCDEIKNIIISYLPKEKFCLYNFDNFINLITRDDSIDIITVDYLLVKSMNILKVGQGMAMQGFTV